MKIMNNYTLKDLEDIASMFVVNEYVDEQLFQYRDIIGIASILMSASPLMRHSDSEISQNHKKVFLEYLELHSIEAKDLCDTYGSYPFNSNALTIKSTPYTRLFSIINCRYKYDYAVITDEELSIKNKDGWSGFYNEDATQWADKFLGILFATKDKYINILNIYNDNISKLMDGLKGKTDVEHEDHRDEDYDTDVTGKNLLNDTPTTTDVISDIEQNQFVSELSKSTAHTDNVGGVDEEGESHTTSENNTKYVMEKIKDIQDNYQKVLYEWSEEFAPLFIEEV